MGTWCIVFGVLQHSKANEILTLTLSIFQKIVVPVERVFDTLMKELDGKGEWTLSAFKAHVLKKYYLEESMVDIFLRPAGQPRETAEPKEEEEEEA